MLFLFSESAKLGKDLILESNFHAENLDRLHKMANEFGYSVLTLVLRGDPEILHKRYLHRIYYENRHPVHLSTTFDIFEDFKAYTERSRAEAVPGKIIPIDANDFSYQKNVELLKVIDAFFAELEE